MKYIKTFLIFILILSASIYIWNLEAFRDFFSFNSSYEIKVIFPDTNASKLMKLENNSAINLRLHIFQARDTAQGAKIKELVLKKGQSKSYERGRYIFHVYKSQSPGSLIMKTNVLWTDIEFRGSEDDLLIVGGPKPPVEIKNNTNEKIKVCAFNNPANTEPLKCWEINTGKTIKWKRTPEIFSIKAFELTSINEPIVTKNKIKHTSKIIINKK